MTYKRIVEGCAACEELEAVQKKKQEEERLRKLEEEAQAPEFEIQKIHVRARGQLYPDETQKTEVKWTGRIRKQKMDAVTWGPGQARVLALDRKWSGHTRMEDIEGKLLDRDYDKRVKEALDKRAKWKSIKKRLKKHIIQLTATNAGPEWFQDLSDRQMSIIDRMMELVIADFEEGIISRTQKALLQFGIFPPLSPKKVWKCMKACQNNVVKFLFTLHKVLVEEEQEEYKRLYHEAKKEGRIISPFSINERLLLSGVFHAHFDTFTYKLDKILPPPYEPPVTLLASRRKPPKKIKYESPYLEPLPINKMNWYEQRAEDELYKEADRKKAAVYRKALLEKVQKATDEMRAKKAEKIRALLEQKAQDHIALTRKRPVKPKDIDDESDPVKRLFGRENKSTYFARKLSKGSDRRIKMEAPSEISRPNSHVRRNKRYMYEVLHEGLQTRTSFGGFFTGDNRLIKDSEGAQMKTRLVPREYDVTCLYRDDSFHAIPVLNTRIRVRCRDVATQTQDEPMFLPLVSVDLEYELATDIITFKDTASTHTNTDEHLLEAERLRDRLTRGIEGRGSRAYEGEKFDPSKCPLSKKPVTVECVDPTCELINEDEVPMDEFTFARRKIAILPPEDQLPAAIEFLKEIGDPLAILPGLEHTPWLLRWFEKRRGIRLKLTNEDKAELMSSSRKLWNAAYNKVGSANLNLLGGKKEIPYTDRLGLKEKLTKHVANLHRKLRYRMVDNARDLFPTLYIEYFTSPINQSLRKTFFTYLPSRELDAFVFRPWAKHETKEKEKLFYDDDEC